MSLLPVIFTCLGGDLSLIMWQKMKNLESFILPIPKNIPGKMEKNTREPLWISWFLLKICEQSIRTFLPLNGENKKVPFAINNRIYTFKSFSWSTACSQAKTFTFVIDYINFKIIFYENLGYPSFSCPAFDSL